MLISKGLEKAAGWRMTNLMSRACLRGEYLYVRSATRGIPTAIEFVIRDGSTTMSLWMLNIVEVHRAAEASPVGTREQEPDRA